MSGKRNTLSCSWAATAACSMARGSDPMGMTAYFASDEDGYRCAT